MNTPQHQVIVTIRGAVYEVTVRGASILRIRYYPDITSNLGRDVDFHHLAPDVQDRIARKLPHE